MNKTVPFDVELVKSGYGVAVTKEGSRLKFVAFVESARADMQLVFVNEEGYVRTYRADGQYLIDEESELDLVMEVEIKEIWLNIYPDGLHYGYDSEHEAHQAASSRSRMVKVEIPV